MAGNTFGTIFRVTTFGESHGAAVGAVIDGCPAGLPLCEKDIQAYLDRRKPGASRFSTARKEGDLCRILSGVFEGKTTGTPIAVIVENTDQRSGDYSALRDVYRPGHADLGYDRKYGFRDYRGGGRSSGRETAGRVIGGAVAAKLLKEFGVEIRAWTDSIGPFRADPEHSELSECSKNALYMPDPAAAEKAEAWLADCIREGDSSGSTVACRITGVPAGTGEPVFDKLDAELAKAVLSIGAVKGIEFGDGFAAAEAKGSNNNDPFRGEGADEAAESCGIAKTSNHAGGILGGMADGSDIFFRAAVKPTPSIARPQQSVTRSGDNTVIEIHGRHDPVIGPRAVVVVECMAAVTVLDLMLRNAVCRLDRLKELIRPC